MPIPKVWHLTWFDANPKGRKRSRVSMVKRLNKTPSTVNISRG